MLRTIYWPQWWYARWLPAKVLSGPFQGMRYTRKATGSVILPKLLGTYELELHPVIEAITPNQYEQIIDVGAGEGYYAVGLCVRFPKVYMLAFETTASGQRNIKALAAKNGLAGHINIRGKCEVGDLNNALENVKQVLLIVDVEGYEKILLDPGLVPGLKHTDFIVEMHPERVENIQEILLDRFAHTHKLQVIPQQKTRTIPKGITLSPYLAKRVGYLINEFRGPQSWLFGKANTNSSN